MWKVSCWLIQQGVPGINANWSGKFQTAEQRSEMRFSIMIMENYSSSSNRSYTSVRTTSRGLVTPNGARITEGTPFTGRASGEQLAFVRRAIVPEGFYMPGGRFGAGIEEWHDNGAETPCAGTIAVTPGSPSSPAVWVFTPGGAEAGSEDFAANAAAYKAAEDAEKSDNTRRAQQHAVAVEAVTKIVRVAYEQNLFSEETIRQARAEAKRLAPDGNFGSWRWLAAGEALDTTPCFGRVFKNLGRCQMSSGGTGRDVQILQAAIGKVKAASAKTLPVPA